MMREPQIAILLPSALGAVSFVCTTVIHALPLEATVNYIRRERSLGRAGAGFWIDVAIVARTISYAIAAHLMEIGCGQSCSYSAGNSQISELHTTTQQSTIRLRGIVYGAYDVLGAIGPTAINRSLDRENVETELSGGGEKPPSRWVIFLLELFEAFVLEGTEGERLEPLDILGGQLLRRHPRRAWLRHMDLSLKFNRHFPQKVNSHTIHIIHTLSVYFRIYMRILLHRILTYIQKQPLLVCSNCVV